MEVILKQELFGDALALRAWQWAVDHGGERGISIEEIEKGVQSDGDTIRGDNPRRVLSSAMNRNNHMLQRVGRGVWRTKPKGDWADFSEGLVGHELEDAAYVTARALHPTQRGFHYEHLMGRLWREGVVVRGKNRGHAMLTMLGRSTRFRGLAPRSGMWTWK